MATVQLRKSKSIDKRMVAVFFSIGGIIKIVLLDKSKTVTSNISAQEKKYGCCSDTTTNNT